MIAGSLIGAAIGGLAIAYAPASFLKAFLGVVLIVAAIKTLGKHEERPQR